MPSSTKKTQNIRKWHERSRGKVRRRKLRNQGSTPAFPIHPEKAEKTETSSQS